MNTIIVLNHISLKSMNLQVPTVRDVHKKSLVKDKYHDLEDWLTHDNHVYIGRSGYVKGMYTSKWHNPFGPKYGSLTKRLNAFEQHARKNLVNNILELQGKVLGCWCDPNPCHGHILVKLYLEKVDKE